MPIEISIQTARRYVLGRQGLWPGRRWRGLEGTEQAMRAIEHLQLDPLVVVARAHDLILHSRVIDYRQDDWATLTYGQRKFFDLGGWLAVRPMDELPYWRVLMRNVLRERGEVANRDFEMGARTRVDHYRGRKDSALALHYLWRIGDVMVSRRERFERVYALTESVAPADLLREHDAAEADDYLLMKTVAAEGLTPMRTVSNALRRTVPPAELAEWRRQKLDAGQLVEVRVEGWRALQVALAEDIPILATLAAGGVPAGWAPLDGTTVSEATFLAPLDPVSARGRARLLFDFDYVWEVYKPAHQRRWGYYTLPILWGDRLMARFDSRLDRAGGTLVVNGLWLEDEALARDDAFGEALGRAMARFARFLDARRVDSGSVTQPSLRRRLSAARRSAAPR